MKKEREVMNLVWKPRRRVDWLGVGAALGPQLGDCPGVSGFS